MDNALYIAMSAAQQSLQTQVRTSGNLANVSTVGFRAVLEGMEGGAQSVSGDGFASRAYGPTRVTGAIDTTSGALMATGRELDVAIEGEGWIAVQDGLGGEAYTRAGELRVSTAGMLTNGSGHPILGDNGPIAIPPYESLEISRDGTITILPVGQSAAEPTVLDRIKLVRDGGADMHRNGHGLYSAGDDVVFPADATVQLASGYLESSNVSAMRSMVQMIDDGRTFEMQVRLMREMQQNDETAAKLLQVSG